jgi:hypothetical protein
MPLPPVTRLAMSVPYMREGDMQWLAMPAEVMLQADTRVVAWSAAIVAMVDMPATVAGMPVTAMAAVDIMTDAAMTMVLPLSAV